MILSAPIDGSPFGGRVDAGNWEEGRQGGTTRPMIGLLDRKHAFNESDESVVKRWVENPYRQFFCGFAET